MRFVALFTVGALPQDLPLAAPGPRRVHGADAGGAPLHARADAAADGDALRARRRLPLPRSLGLAPPRPVGPPPLRLRVPDPRVDGVRDVFQVRAAHQRHAARRAVGREGRVPLLPRARDRPLPHARLPRLLRTHLHLLWKAFTTSPEPPAPRQNPPPPSAQRAPFAPPLQCRCTSCATSTSRAARSARASPTSSGTAASRTTCKSASPTPPSRISRAPTDHLHHRREPMTAAKKLACVPLLPRRAPDRALVASRPAPPAAPPSSPPSPHPTRRRWAAAEAASGRERLRPPRPAAPRAPGRRRRARAAGGAGGNGMPAGFMNGGRAVPRRRRRRPAARIGGGAPPAPPVDVRRRRSTARGGRGRLPADDGAGDAVVERGSSPDATNLAGMGSPMTGRADARQPVCHVASPFGGDRRVGALRVADVGGGMGMGGCQ